MVAQRTGTKIEQGRGGKDQAEVFVLQYYSKCSTASVRRGTQTQKVNTYESSRRLTQGMRMNGNRRYRVHTLRLADSEDSDISDRSSDVLTHRLAMGNAEWVYYLQLVSTL